MPAPAISPRFIPRLNPWLPSAPRTASDRSSESSPSSLLPFPEGVDPDQRHAGMERPEDDRCCRERDSSSGNACSPRSRIRLSASLPAAGKRTEDAFVGRDARALLHTTFAMVSRDVPYIPPGRADSTSRRASNTHRQIWQPGAFHHAMIRHRQGCTAMMHGSRRSPTCQ